MPGTVCSVAGCPSSAAKAKVLGERIMFFQFPANPIQRQEWVRRCNRKGKWHPENKRICHKHFTASDYEDEMQARLLNTVAKKLKPTALPTVNLRLKEADKENKAPAMSARTQRLMKKRRQQLVQEILTSAERDSTESLEKPQQPQSSIQGEGSSAEQESEPSQHTLSTQLSTSTDADLMENLQHKYNAVVAENAKLHQQLKEMQTAYSTATEHTVQLQKAVDAYETQFQNKVKQIMSPVLTANQMDLVMKKKSRVCWTPDELAKAFTLRYFSKRTYVYLRKTLKYPLPGISTLQKWAATINLHNGLLKDVLRIMEAFGQTKTEVQKLTVLSFDEVKVSHTYEYDQKNDDIVGPHHYMQIVMARGLCDNWKQPIFIGFDTKITKPLLDTILTELNAIQHTVVACVSDCGSSNVGLWKELGVTSTTTFYTHPVTKDRVYFFADVPHLLKLIRNWLLDTGFCLGDGSIITREPLEKLIEGNITEISSCYKLTMHHILCEKTQRQNVRLAAELLSHTTATALKRYCSGDSNEPANKLGAFIELVNQWFDVFNSYTSKESVPTKVPFGLKLKDQIKVLHDMKDTVFHMRCINKTALQIFQKGILISSTSLEGLYSTLKEKYNIQYILTHRLNQDCLENFFSQLRTRGGLHDHPSPLNALYRIRMILLGKNPGIVQQHTNVPVEDSNNDYVMVGALQRASIPPSPECAPHGDTEDETFSTSSSSTNSSRLPSSSVMIETDGLEYVAGYLARKFSDKYPALGAFTYQCEKLDIHNYSVPSWVQSLSFGGLTKPSASWLATVQQMDTFFLKYHKDTFRRGKGIVKRTARYVCKKLPTVPGDLAEAFCRQRIFIRMKFLSQHNKTLKRKVVASSSKVNKKIKRIVQ